MQKRRKKHFIIYNYVQSSLKPVLCYVLFALWQHACLHLCAYYVHSDYCCVTLHTATHTRYPPLIHAPIITLHIYTPHYNYTASYMLPYLHYTLSLHTLHVTTPLLHTLHVATTIHHIDYFMIFFFVLSLSPSFL